MVAKTLTDKMVRSGAELVRRLDDRGVRPDAAFWLYLPELDEWKLVLAEAKLSTQGPRAAYEEFQKALAQKPELESMSLDLVALAKPDAPLVRLLGSAIRTGEGISGIRFTNNVINGTVIEDAYIYRLVVPAEAQSAGASEEDGSQGETLPNTPVQQTTFGRC